MLALKISTVHASSGSGLIQDSAFLFLHKRTIQVTS